MMEFQEAKEAQTEEAPPPVPATAAVIYVGPNISRLGLQRFRVYKGGVPASAKGESALACLFVLPEKLRAASAALTVEGSPEWSAYRDALAASRKRGA